jgi:hypothetical protein
MNHTHQTCFNTVTFIVHENADPISSIMMKLYAFGYIPPNRSDAHETFAPSTASTPTCILEAHAIRILWSSWCDVVITYQASPAEPWISEYRGTSLSSAQKEHVATSSAIKTALSTEDESIEFFGSELHHGLQGYILRDPGGNNSVLVVFSTDVEIENGAPPLRTIRINENWKVTALRIDPRGEALASIMFKSTSGGQIFCFKDLADLQDHLHQDPLQPSSAHQIASFTPTQWHTNCTTSIALDTHGQLYTATSDSRYQKCLGRPSTDSPNFEAVPYFSETSVRKVAAGGYMATAISSDDELFLWGQANPGCNAGLSVLGEEDLGNDDAYVRERAATGVRGSSGFQDEIIKSLEVFIDGEEARPYDVATGNGHVLVAAEVQKADGTMKRAVLGAGLNDRLQTGLPKTSAFVEDFEEIVAFRDMTIEELVATGWTTYAVTQEN